MNYEQEYLRWLASDALTEDERQELLSIKNNDELRRLRFSSPMAFGTGGLRSEMHMGIASMNRFTVAQATRGIAKLVKDCGGEERGVAIAYDSRNNSALFARVSASVLAGAGIKVYIFDGIRPTPELSFAVRELSAMAGINITASHNPKEYNGYKAYWEDGAQIGPEQAEVVSAALLSFDVLDTDGIMPYEEALEQGLIVELGCDFDEKYIAAVMSTAVDPSAVREVADELSVVYSPLHGAGYRLVPEVFRRMGLRKLCTVESQMIPDGNFPTVKKPNPEYAESFAEGIRIANEVGSDTVIATDPDSDRVGVMTRTQDGSFKTVSGNQMGALLLDYVIKQKKKQGRITDKSYCVKSIVSTDMAYRIAEVNGVKLYDVLTGFKFIGEVIKNHEKTSTHDDFLLGFEESYGYLLGTYARDKDAVEASMMILEMIAYYKKRGMTLSDALDELYETYGYYAERTGEIYMEGLDGIERRKRTMHTLRTAPPRAVAGVRVVSVGDYLLGTVTDLESGSVSYTDQPRSDVLYYTLDGGDKIIVRPSGTEPKIKIYVLAHGASSDEVEEKCEKYEAATVKFAEV